MRRVVPSRIIETMQYGPELGPYTKAVDEYIIAKARAREEWLEAECLKLIVSNREPIIRTYENGTEEVVAGPRLDEEIKP